MLEPELPAPRRPRTLEESLEPFLLWLKAARGRSEATVRAYGIDLADITAFCQEAGVEEPARVTHQLIEFYLAFAEWDDPRPGFLEVDLVAHCEWSTEGFPLWTLSTVDVAPGWVELDAVWGKGQQRVRAGIHNVRQRLPMPLLGLDRDNVSECITHALWGHCQQAGIPFTRSRLWKKHDSAHVEQKNGAIVRALIGYDRSASKAASAQLARVYRLPGCT